MCQKTKRYIQKRIVHLQDEAGEPEKAATVERIIAELQAVLDTMDAPRREIVMEPDPVFPAES
jgi:hypothetical protein